MLRFAKASIVAQCSEVRLLTQYVRRFGTPVLQNDGVSSLRPLVFPSSTVLTRKKIEGNQSCNNEIHPSRVRGDTEL